MLRRMDLLDVLLFCGLAGVIGIINIRSRETPLPWIAEPYEESPTSCSVSESIAENDGLERIAVADALLQLGSDSIAFVDARSPLEFEQGHLPGAFNLPLDQAENFLGTQSLPIAPDQLVVTYCAGGACEISESLGQMLKDRRVCRRVQVLEGGWLGWLSANAPIETTNPNEERIQSSTSKTVASVPLEAMASGSESVLPAAAGMQVADPQHAKEDADALD